MDSHGSLGLPGDVGSLWFSDLPISQQIPHKPSCVLADTFCEVTHLFSRVHVALSTVYEEKRSNDYGNKTGKNTEA
jgi:hypothetical protein